MGLAIRPCWRAGRGPYDGAASDVALPSLGSLSTVAVNKDGSVAEGQWKPTVLSCAKSTSNCLGTSGHSSSGEHSKSMTAFPANVDSGRPLQLPQQMLVPPHAAHQVQPLWQSRSLESCRRPKDTSKLSQPRLPVLPSDYWGICAPRKCGNGSTGRPLPRRASLVWIVRLMRFKMLDQTLHSG